MSGYTLLEFAKRDTSCEKKNGEVVVKCLCEMTSSHGFETSKKKLE